uniref:Uncharacterized protein LOC114914365 isoform X1 n=1 Tax=Elaeis guineensis var. tenera TaxID=51953 RepID=A0A8N4F5L7_ELAGV|nr:uncharacterized protein LOC114914365 isoform X1 [Elaeis guineensis]
MDFRLRELPLGLAVAEHRLPCFSRAGFAATPLASWARTKVMCLQEQQQVLSSGLVWRYLITKWIATVKVNSVTIFLYILRDLEFWIYIYLQIIRSLGSYNSNWI